MFNHRFSLFCVQPKTNFQGSKVSPKIAQFTGLFKQAEQAILFPGCRKIKQGVARRRGSPPARSGLAASTAGEEPRQDPARNWSDTGKRIAYSGHGWLENSPKI
jgi:hypothetical protein